ncbi:MAG: deoxyribodipyrimidine photo-lyase, partial [Albidovulum sp.]|uniref:deoxyribodipyrimidine photo-lyase n=1 Tax=Albidovulum sp. TaxID=1872424 RepID=UPI001329B4E2
MKDVADDAPVILWFRRDLRLGDHAALTAAVASGRPVIPVFLHDETVDRLGAAATWRLAKGIGALAAALEARGARLILRRGAAREALLRLVAETGATAVH